MINIDQHTVKKYIICLLFGMFLLIIAYICAHKDVRQEIKAEKTSDNSYNIIVTQNKTIIYPPINIIIKFETDENNKLISEKTQFTDNTYKNERNSRYIIKYLDAQNENTIYFSLIVMDKVLFKNTKQPICDIQILLNTETLEIINVD